MGERIKEFKERILLRGLAEIYEEKVGKQLIDTDVNTKRMGFQIPGSN